jgi:hypothetical protein
VSSGATMRTSFVITSPSVAMRASIGKRPATIHPPVGD